MEYNDLGIKESITGIFEVVQLINTSRGGSIFKPEEIDEENGNITDLEEELKGLINSLEIMKKVPNLDKKILLHARVYLHIAIGNIESQYYLLHDMVEKILVSIAKEMN